MPMRHLEQLFSDFQRHPREFFHERELHAHFFGIAREPLGLVATADGAEVHRLRYEYNSIWRYVGQDNYVQRHSAKGNPLELDFALIRDDFIQSHSHLAVVNKDESLRAGIRAAAEQSSFSPVIRAGIEFKMTHLRSSGSIDSSAVETKRQDLLKDCRKLAHERVEDAFVLMFSHGPHPLEEQAQALIADCQREFHDIHQAGNLFVFVVTPELICGPDMGVDVPVPPPPEPVPPPEPPIRDSTRVPDHFFGRAKIVCYQGEFCHLNAFITGGYHLRRLDDLTWRTLARGTDDLAGLARLCQDFDFVENGPTDVNVNNTALWRRFFDQLRLRHQC